MSIEDVYMPQRCSPALCRRRFVSSTTLSTFGTCTCDAERMLMNNIASSCAQTQSISDSAYIAVPMAS